MRPASPSPECTSVQQELPEQAQDQWQEAKVARDTPGRAAAVRQNATDLMDEEVHRWAVTAAEPRKELLF